MISLSENVARIIRSRNEFHSFSETLFTCDRRRRSQTIAFDRVRSCVIIRNTIMFYSWDPVRLFVNRILRSKTKVFHQLRPCRMTICSAHLVSVRLLQFPAVCCLGAWVRLVFVTSPRSIWRLMTVHTERGRSLVTRQMQCSVLVAEQ